MLWWHAASCLFGVTFTQVNNCYRPLIIWDVKMGTTFLESQCPHTYRHVACGQIIWLEIGANDWTVTVDTEHEHENVRLVIDIRHASNGVREQWVWSEPPSLFFKLNCQHFIFAQCRESLHKQTSPTRSASINKESFRASLWRRLISLNYGLGTSAYDCSDSRRSLYALWIISAWQILLRYRNVV